MKYTDLAGNPTKYTDLDDSTSEYKERWFTVDKTAPKINVEYTSDNQTIQPGEIELNRLYKKQRYYSNCYNRRKKLPERK